MTISGHLLPEWLSPVAAALSPVTTLAAMPFQRGHADVDGPANCTQNHLQVQRHRAPHLGRARITLPVFAASILALLAASVVPVTGATTAESLAQAKARLLVLRAEGREFAQKFDVAEERLDELDDQIAATTARLDSLTRASAAQRADLARIAARLYVSGSASQPQPNPRALDVARSTTYEQTLADRDRAAIERYGRTASELRDRKATLNEAKDQQQESLSELAAQRAQLDKRLAETQAIYDRYGIKLAQEAAAAEAEAAAAKARADAARTATTRRPSSNPGSGSGTTPPTRPTATTTPSGGGGGGGGGTPAGGAYGMTTCPVRGANYFTDTWGAPRSGGRQHKGVDMMAAQGTPVVAVVNGTIVQRSGSNQGLGIFFAGDNGNSYWYFHLVRYEGGPRRASAGEVIGYVGHTGATRADHLHFEIHPGGGGPVNPTAAVRAVC